MSVYVGIDVHRKRSQVAVINQDGKVLANRNVPNGVKPILSVIGGLPAGTKAAFEAAFGWGWLVELLEDYGFEPHLVHPLQCKAIASARLKTDLLTELPNVSAVQARCAPRQPTTRMSGRSESPGRRGAVVSQIATETEHTRLNRSPAFSSLPIFDISRSGP
jgi:transposase